MKKIAFLICIAVMGLIVAANAQDKIYGAFFTANQVKSITANPTTGLISGDWNGSMSTVQTAALGVGTWNGTKYLVYLQYESNDHVDIWARLADGTGNAIKIKNNADFADGDNDLDYVRLGFDANNTGWVVLKQSLGSNIYIGNFTWNGSMISPSVIITKKGLLNTSDFSNGIFSNGDLAVAGNVLYVLANNGSGTTKIYNVSIPSLASATGSSTNALQYRWTLQNSSGSNFSGTVNGFAFASGGSAYLSTSNGLYFIDQTTTNFNGSGTVKCSLIKSGTDLGDLATENVPALTYLPVHFHNVKVTLTHK
jgi:hypothetical protein